MKFNRILLFLAFPIFLFSCKTTEKPRYYIENASVDTSGINVVKIPDWTIQKKDILSIQIFSISTKPEQSDVIYNQPGAGAGGPTLTSGYLVDLQGNIVHHRLGIFHVEGMTKQELENEIKKRLTEPVELLRDPTVTIRLLNFRVTIFGEVGKPGQISVPSESLTVLEAIGLAGDISPYGKKHEVRILREINGKREVGVIDLASKDLFNSPYYNLAQNDILFVEPTRRKLRQEDQQIVSSRISLALGVITAAAFLYNIFK